MALPFSFALYIPACHVVQQAAIGRTCLTVGTPCVATVEALEQEIGPTNYSLRMPELPFFQLLHDQRNPPPVVNADLSGKTAIVVGANVGIGFETARHFARMNPGKLILACRNKQKGEAAATQITEETGCQTVEPWVVDLSEFASVISFAERFEKEGGRLDILVINAGISQSSLEYSGDGWELTYQINYLSTTLLPLLLLPRIFETAQEHKTTPRLVFVSSFTHFSVKLDSKLVNAPDVLQLYGHKDHFSERFKTYPGDDVYGETKLLVILFVRALNERLNKKPIIVNAVDPGFCKSSITRHRKGFASVLLNFFLALIGRTAEEGSRQLVWAAVGAEGKEDELRGAFVDLASRVAEPSDFAISEQGHVAQDKIWDNLVGELSKVAPRVREIVQEYL